jgi:hypothetical protein
VTATRKERPNLSIISVVQYELLRIQKCIIEPLTGIVVH